MAKPTKQQIEERYVAYSQIADHLRASLSLLLSYQLEQHTGEKSRLYTHMIEAMDIATGQRDATRKSLRELEDADVR